MTIWKESLSDKMFNIIVVFLMLILSFVMLYPFWYLMVFSLNDPMDALRGGIYFWPRQFSLVAYQQVWTTHNLGRAAFISVSRTVIGTTATVFCTAMLSYVLSREHLAFRKFFNRLFITTMYVSGGLIPWFLTLNAFGFGNTFRVYIIPALVAVFSMILIRTFMQELPSTLPESAEVDGANDFVIFMRIVLPLCTPVLAVAAIFAAVGQWNAWFDAAVFNATRHDLRPLQLILMGMLRNAVIRTSRDVDVTGARHILTPESVRAAITMIVTLPIVAIYPFFQRYFTQGIMLGSVKG